jgi:hypothetical protein
MALCLLCAADASAACPNTNFLKGIQWAPDGSCCLTASDDNRYEQTRLKLPFILHGALPGCSIESFMDR